MKPAVSGGSSRAAARRSTRCSSACSAGVSRACNPFSLAASARTSASVTAATSSPAILAYLPVGTTDRPAAVLNATSPHAAVGAGLGAGRRRSAPPAPAHPTAARRSDRAGPYGPARRLLRDVELLTLHRLVQDNGAFELVRSGPQHREDED